MRNLVVLLGLFLVLGCDDGEAERQQQMKQERDAAQRHVTNARDSLRRKVESLEAQIEILVAGVREMRTSRESGDIVLGTQRGKSSYEIELEGKIAELENRLKPLQKQLDYIESYNKLPPDSLAEE